MGDFVDHNRHDQDGYTKNNIYVHFGFTNLLYYDSIAQLTSSLNQWPKSVKLQREARLSDAVIQTEPVLPNSTQRAWSENILICRKREYTFQNLKKLWFLHFQQELSRQ